MKNLLYIGFLLFIIQDSLMSQISTYWIGGQPGKSRDWNTSSNWSNSKVPNEFSDVKIVYKESNVDCYPEINKGSFKVHSITIEHGASLRIQKNAELTIFYEAAADLIIENIDIRGNLHLRYLKNKDLAALK
ncbi:MAG: hypothetical protein HOP11_06360 [Saprospiraceae bacterium]|nr:hypothetical protein [Saprospiraceae bacterium]